MNARSCAVVAFAVATGGLPCPAQEEPAAAPPLLVQPIVIGTPVVLGVAVPGGAAASDVGPAARPAKPEFPVPPAEDASDPQRIVHYFCRAWKDWDFKAMYGAMAEDYRGEVSYRRFEGLFKGDIETNGGLLDESIAPEPESAGAAIRLKVVLRFRSAAPRTVIAVAEREGADGWRIAGSGIIPLDLDDL